MIQEASRLQKNKDWNRLILLIEGLEPTQKQYFAYPLIEALNKSGQWDKLLQVCEETIAREDAEEGPKPTWVRTCRAQALSRLDRYPDSLKAHAELGRLGIPVGFVNACALAQAHQDWEALIPVASGLSTTQPGPGLSYKGEALARLGRYDEAEAVLEKAVTYPGHTAMAWSDLALIRNLRRAFPAAVEAADRALAMDPANVVALCHRGGARFGLQQYAEGRQDFAAALATGMADEATTVMIRQNIDMADRYLAHTKKRASPQKRP
ncbi:MAG: hypothetical protein LWX11_09050 [Firmicutes bacterium]|nr:hypothetical protein [Bacillota bacterium]